MKAKNFYLIRRRAFSLIELFIAMIIIAIFTSFITANISSQSQTVKSEAEKLTAYITDLTRKADRRHINFTIKFHSGYTHYYWNHGKSDDDKTRGFLYHENPEKIDRTKYTLLTNEPVLTPGFSLTGEIKNSQTGVYDTNKNELVYNSNGNEFSDNATITITRLIDGSVYYIVIYEGRIRASEVKPSTTTSPD